MQKWNVLLSGFDGRKFYQNVHVIERTAESAGVYLKECYPDRKVRSTIQVMEVEPLEDAELFLPGIVYVSGKAYFE